MILGPCADTMAPPAVSATIVAIRRTEFEFMKLTLYRRGIVRVIRRRPRRQSRTYCRRGRRVKRVQKRRRPPPESDGLLCRAGAARLPREPTAAAAGSDAAASRRW